MEAKNVIIGSTLYLAKDWGYVSKVKILSRSKQFTDFFDVHSETNLSSTFADCRVLFEDEIDACQYVLNAARDTVSIYESRIMEIQKSRGISEKLSFKDMIFLESLGQS